MTLQRAGERVVLTAAMRRLKDGANAGAGATHDYHAAPAHASGSGGQHLHLSKARGSMQAAACGPGAEQPGLPDVVSALLQTLQHIAHGLQHPQHSQQQGRRARRRSAPHVRASATPSEAAAAAQPRGTGGSQHRGASFLFASASPRAAALAAQPSRAGGSQPCSAEPGHSPPEVAKAAPAGDRDQVSTASTVRALEPPGPDQSTAQAGSQTARGAEASPSAAQRQRGGAAARGEAQRPQQRHWRWPREWALPRWQPPQLSGFVLPSWAAQAVGGKQKLLTVQQFFNYVENEGAPSGKRWPFAARQSGSAGETPWHDMPCMITQVIMSLQPSYALREAI